MVHGPECKVSLPESKRRLAFIGISRSLFGRFDAPLARNGSPHSVRAIECPGRARGGSCEGAHYFPNCPTRKEPGWSSPITRPHALETGDRSPACSVLH